MLQPTMRRLSRVLCSTFLLIPAPAQAQPTTSAAPGAVQPTRATPPAPGRPKDFRLPPRQSIALPNGMAITLIPYGRVPKVAVELQLRTGVIDEGPTDVSLASVTGDMLLEGTATRTAQDISRQAADIGGTLAVSPGAETISIGGEVLSDFATSFVALVADVARRPRFDEADLRRIIDKHARDNAIALAAPGTIAQKTFREITYGDHPFARIYPPEEMLRAFTVARVRDFYAKNFGGERAHLYISGVFDAKAMERAAREAFGDWPAGTPATVHPPVPAARRQLVVVDRPKAVQSSIWMGLPVPDPTSPDWIRLNVTDALLGGSFGSRITTNIREDKGYTYSPFSFLWTRRGSSMWVEVADVTTSATGPSLKEIFYEIDRLRTQAPPDSELAGIRNNMAGVFTIQNSSRSGVINQLQFVDLHGLGDAYLENYVKNVLAVTAEDVRSTAQKAIDPSKISVAIVGDRRVIDKQLGPYRAVVP